MRDESGNKRCGAEHRHSGSRIIASVKSGTGEKIPATRRFKECKALRISKGLSVDMCPRSFNSAQKNFASNDDRKCALRIGKNALRRLSEENNFDV